MSRGYYEIYTLEELVERENPLRANIEYSQLKPSIEENLLKTDKDANRPLTWTQAYKTAAYYFENPNQMQRLRALNSFRFDFANLLSKTANPNEIPDLRSRGHFVNWVCKKHNEFLEANNSDVKVDCNTEKLINAYGPDYKKVRDYLGEYDQYV